MAVSLLLTSITAAIDDISVSGVTIKNYDGIAASWQSRPRVLYPHPEDFVTDFEIEFPTLLRGSGAPQDISYTINYRYLGTAVGDPSQMPQQYSELVTDVIAIVNALAGVDAPYSGKVEMQILDISLGARSDPVENMYFGADIALRITEMQN